MATMHKLFIILMGALLMHTAEASGGHWRGGFSYGWGGHSHWGPRSGVYFGDPFWGPYYDPFYDPFPPRYYYAPRTVIIEPREPPVYVQRAEPNASRQPVTWYYCPEPAGYYPHVPSCTRAWVPVDPATLPPPPGP